ncbi:MAG: DNA alkylation repair protein [Aeromicrobium sp.]
MSEPTAAQFSKRLSLLQDPVELEKIRRYFKTGPGEYADGDVFMGVRMGHVFALAQEFIDMEPDEIEKLLDDPIHEIRAGACSIMSKQATRKRTTDERRKELFDLYLRRHDRINNWDLVDLAGRQVVGAQLNVKPRDLLHDLAASSNLWERRTAITAASVMHDGDLDNFYAIAEILLHDPEDIINKCVGGWIRNAGKIDQPRLLRFLDEHAATMPRVTLRFSIEHLDKETQAHYRALKQD